ncbi:MAG: transcriptional regulator, partial [Chloroflexia bacterium]|nr:transcriptional regulator [Chloroflexia bacterium]
METFGGILEKMLASRGVSKKELAARVGLSPSYISLLSNGTRKIPSIDMIRLFAQALHLSSEEENLLLQVAGFLEVEELIAKKIKIDWGNAPEFDIFYNRQEEMALLEQWILRDKSRVISLVGLGGIGKTALSLELIKRIENEMDYIVWRTLRAQPSLDDLLVEIIKSVENDVSDKFYTVQE